ncbi:hypothetical protein OG225_43205 (plasmid) [Nocardia sp. NBC_01377]|uniref:hypothetical protein n=1 Tax=Nocardia sp. NBC_01377 TaxID=2903595 RepID=UPI002F9137A0
MRFIPHALTRLLPRRRPRAGLPYADFGAPMPWQLQMDTGPSEPAEPCPEHAHALELRRHALNLETLANNPELADPDGDPKELAARDYYAELDAAEETLHAYLIAHRDVLGDYPEWAAEYDFIDHPDEV